MLVHLRSSTSNLKANAERGRLSEDKLQVSDELNASQYGKTFLRLRGALAYKSKDGEFHMAAYRLS